MNEDSLSESCGVAAAGIGAVLSAGGRDWHAESTKTTVLKTMIGIDFILGIGSAPYVDSASRFLVTGFCRVSLL